MKTGVFGGTFDPIHVGHLDIARAALEQFALDRVLFIPSLTPPHKKDKTGITPAPFRYRMVEMAIQDEPRFEVSDVELNRPGISYTADTLAELKKKYPSDELYFILGADSAAEISNWHKPEEIMRLSKLIAARRPGHFAQPPIPGLQWINLAENPVSSSEIRCRLAKGEKLGAEVLPEKVETYIRKMKLYET